MSDNAWRAVILSIWCGALFIMGSRFSEAKTLEAQLGTGLVAALITVVVINIAYQASISTKTSANG